VSSFGFIPLDKRQRKETRPQSREIDVDENEVEKGVHWLQGGGMQGKTPGKTSLPEPNEMYVKTVPYSPIQYGT